MSTHDPELEALGRAAREREQARAAWEADADADPQFKTPLDAAERAQILAKVLPPEEKKSPWGVFTFGAGFAVAAAAVLLTVVPGGGDPSLEYRLEVLSSGHQTVRGDGPKQDTLKLVHGMQVDIVLRPSTAPEGEIAAKAFLQTKAGLQPLAWAPKIAPTGAVRFVGTAGESFALPEDAVALVFGVGPPETIAGWAGGDTEGVRRLAQPILRAEAP